MPKVKYNRLATSKAVRNANNHYMKILKNKTLSQDEKYCPYCLLENKLYNPYDYIPTLKKHIKQEHFN